MADWALNFAGIFTEPKVPGVGGLATRHDNQRVGLAIAYKNRRQQSIDENQSGRVLRKRRLFRVGGQPAREILVHSAVETVVGECAARTLSSAREKKT